VELGQLPRWFEKRQRGERYLGCIVGETGSGKTTLVRALTERVSPESTLWVGYGQCAEPDGVWDVYCPILET